MSNLTHDADLPFAILNDDGNIIARFVSAADARYFADEEDYRVVNTTPIPLPKGFGAVVAIPGSMPLIRVLEQCWVMPMVGLPEERGHPGIGGVQPLAKPAAYGKYRFTDAEVRELIARKNGKFTGVDGVE